MPFDIHCTYILNWNGIKLKFFHWEMNLYYWLIIFLPLDKTKHITYEVCSESMLKDHPFCHQNMVCQTRWSLVTSSMVLIWFFVPEDWGLSRQLGFIVHNISVLVYLYIPRYWISDFRHVNKAITSPLCDKDMYSLCNWWPTYPHKSYSLCCDAVAGVKQYLITRPIYWSAIVLKSLLLYLTILSSEPYSVNSIYFRYYNYIKKTEHI